MVSRSNKLFQKHKAKNKRDLVRRKAVRSERRRALIICEGEKTEPLYIRALVVSLGLTTAEVEVCGDCGSAPKSVVKFGESKFNADPDYDLIFFVFDRDSHPSYEDALRLVSGFKQQRKFRGTKCTAITSVPCFEIWFLVHFEPHTRPYSSGGGKSPCGNLISVLKGKPGFECYEKASDSYFDQLRGRLHDAKRNAAIVVQQSREAGDADHYGNPTTLMHKLVEALEAMADEARIDSS